MGEDLDGGGRLGITNEVSAERGYYVGAASAVEIIPNVYPKDTEFMHTVRYVGVDTKGGSTCPSG